MLYHLKMQELALALTHCTRKSSGLQETEFRQVPIRIQNLHVLSGRRISISIPPARPVESIMTDDTKLRLNPFRSAPNILTLLRICLAPFLVAAVLDNRYRAGFVMFVVAGLSDALDGLLARKLKQHTVLGEYLDPVADKLLLSALFLVLMYKGLIPREVTVMVFGRDIGILLVSAILFAAAGRREFHPSLFGKANTLVQIVAVAVVLLLQLTHAVWVVVLRAAALDATMILTVISGLHYAWLAARRNNPTAAGGPAAH